MEPVIIFGMGLLEFVLIVLAIVIVVVVLYFQSKSFKETKEKITQLAGFFPNEASFELVQSSITKEILQSKSRLEDFINNPPQRHSPEPPSILPVDEDVDDSDKAGIQTEQIEYSDVDLI